MATGLDKILEQIRADAEKKAAADVAQAELEAKKILAQAEEDAESKAADILAEGERVCADIAVKSQSASEFSRRRTVLAAKQSAIRETIEAAKTKLHDLPDDEYFAVLLKLAKKNAAGEGAEMRLSAKDIARLPADFETKLAEAAGVKITVSKTPCGIADGFLLVYGGIDVNCTFDSLFEADADALQDLAGSMLFA